MLDSRNFSILTYSAYRNQTNCFKIIFEYIKRYGLDFKNEDASSHEKLKDYVDSITDDQFTSLHFAAKHGNYTMLSLLCESAEANMYI